MGIPEMLTAKKQRERKREGTAADNAAALPFRARPRTDNAGSGPGVSMRVRYASSLPAGMREPGGAFFAGRQVNTGGAPVAGRQVNTGGAPIAWRKSSYEPFPRSGNQTVIQRQVKNAVNAEEKTVIDGIIGDKRTAAEKAAALKSSDNAVFTYGKTPGTDEQVEILAGADYLKYRKGRWTDLFTKPQEQQETLKEQEPWYKTQKELGVLSGQDEVKAPWFLDPMSGYHDLQDAENRALLAAAGRKMRRFNDREPGEPQSEEYYLDERDPQELMGTTYGRDTLFTSDSTHAAAGRNLRVGGIGDVIRVNLNKADEKRIIIRNVTVNTKVLDAQYAHISPKDIIALEVFAKPYHDETHYIGVTAAIPNLAGSTGGDHALVDVVTKNMSYKYKISYDNGVNWTDLTEKDPDTFRIEEKAYFRSVTMVDDALGMSRQTLGHVERNRAGAPRATDDTAATLIRTNLDGGQREALGPSRNKLNIQELGWGISVADYRRLGGDALFNELEHQDRDPAGYDGNIPFGLNAEQKDWYSASQKDKCDRFVGGLSNSTLLYLKSATLLYHEGKLSLDECRDVMAFVIADMTVSGDHSLPECMTGVVMASRYVSPWNETPLNITAPVKAIASWLMLVHDDIQAVMKADAESSLNAVLAQEELDYTLIKVLTALNKVFTGA